MERIAEVTKADYFSIEMITDIKKTLSAYPENLKITGVERVKIRVTDIIDHYDVNLFVAAFSNPRTFCSAFVDAVQNIA